MVPLFEALRNELYGLVLELSGAIRHKSVRNPYSRRLMDDCGSCIPDCCVQECEDANIKQ